MKNGQEHEKLLESLEEKYHPYILSVEKLEENAAALSNFQRETESQACPECIYVQVDINGIFRDMLGFKEPSMAETLDFLIEYSIINTKKNAMFAAKEDTLFLIFKKPSKAAGLFSKISRYESMRAESIKKLEFYRENHPNQFLSKTLLRKDLETLDYLAIKEAEASFVIDDPSILSENHVNLEAITVNSGKVKEHLRQEIVRKLAREFKQVDFFLASLHFKSNDFDFRNIDDPEKKASSVLSDIWDVHWNRLGDSDFLDKVEGQIGKYRFSEVFNAETFLENNSEFFLSFEKETRREIVEHFSTKTIKDIIESDETFSNLYPKYELLREHVIKNPDTLSSAKEYYKVIKSNEFIKNQKEFFETTRLKLKEMGGETLEGFFGIKVEDFIREFDLSAEKKNYNAFLEYDYVLLDMKEFIGNFKEEKSNFITPGSFYLNILNSHGGTFLILFDMIKMDRFGTKDFETYKTFFSEAKATDFEYKKRVVVFLFLFSNILFRDEFKGKENMFLDAYLKDGKLFEEDSGHMKKLRRLYDSLLEQEKYIRDVYSLKTLIEEAERENQ